MEKVYILGGLRTPIVTKNGRFKTIRPEHLGAAVLRELMHQYHLQIVDGIFCGNAVGTGGNIARLMALEAGAAPSVPACTLDMQCASAAAALDFAFSRLASGQGDVYIAGGIESSSLQPVRQYDPKDERYKVFPQGCYKTAQFSPGELSQTAMLEGAERTAQAEQVTRQELDEWVLRSHQRAAAARKDGILQDCILPVQGWQKDDGIRDRMSQRLLDRLPPLLGRHSLTTAGNSCLINDGAALAVLCSERYIREHALQPQARLLAVAAVGGEPSESPRGAMRTADCLLGRMGLSYQDMAAIEFNEAFAVIDVLFSRRFPELAERYNRFGGALAYGHPYGASGTILLLHLLKSLQYVQGGYGILSIAGAGGMGEAVLVEACR